MAGWHHRLDGHGFGWTPGVGDGQGGLVCCSSRGHKELDTTERLNWIELIVEHVHKYIQVYINISTYIHIHGLSWWLRQQRIFLQCRRPGPNPGLGRSPGELNGNSHQYSCLENLMDRGPWRATQSLRSQRVGHDWVTSTKQDWIQIHVLIFMCYGYNKRKKKMSDFFWGIQCDGQGRIFLS